MNTPVNFELAKLLKEEGFDKPTEANWWILAKDHSENYKKRLPVDETKVFFTKDSYELELNTQIDEEIGHNVYHVLSVPTIAEVVMWLYEKHGIWIEVSREYGKDKYIYQYFIDTNNQEFGFNSPTEAYEAAIEHCLTKIIN